MRGRVHSRLIYIIMIMSLVTLAALALSGGPKIEQDPRYVTRISAASNNKYDCCDTGSGSACHPILDKQITYNGQAYALLKSNIFNSEAKEHLAHTNQFSPDGRRIFINMSDVIDAKKDIWEHLYPGSNCKKGDDFIGLQIPTVPSPYFGGYFCVPNDQIIYVCRDSAGECNQGIKDGATPFDAYYRLSDGPVSTNISSKCPKPNVTPEVSKQRIVGVQKPKGQNNLQLETFFIEQDTKPTEWLTAWCKPAIYLYPQRQTQVHVQVEPKGAFTLTIPQYPQGGWNVTAYPDGSILDHGKTYPYLYWEASLPDELIKEPKEGYIVAYHELAPLFSNILPQLGLNTKETHEFSDYWLKALPKANYYFVGVMPTNDIDYLAPLTIKPTPDSILRVTLFFKALDTKYPVLPPSPASFERKGFTVTEWGGFFKADKNHKGFTCLM